MGLLVDRLIYLYMFVCLCLLAFNVIYILGSRGVKERRKGRQEFWRGEIKRAWKERNAERGLSEDHLALLGRRLGRVEELMAFHSALFLAPEALEGEERLTYLEGCRPVLASMAWKYAQRGPMERAFFACVISLCFRAREENEDLIRPLMAFLEASTVYLREHVLRALAVLGDGEAIGRAFDELTERGWHHNAKLIGDGLALYPGEPRELILELWRKREGWLDCLTVGIIQYASSVAGDFSEEFLEALRDQKTPREIRFALLRYFRRKPDPLCRDELIELLDRRGEALAIGAAAALSSYPGEETRQALKRALSSPNWYVRRNAALSLYSLGLSQREAEEIIRGKDRYAGQMLEYVMEERAVRGKK